MNSIRFNQRSSSAKINAGVLAVILFGLVLCGLVAWIIPGGEAPFAGGEVALSYQQGVSQSLVIDDIMLQSPDFISEELEIQKVKIACSHAGFDKTSSEPGATIRGRVFVGPQGKAGIEVVALRSKPYHQMETITAEDGFYTIKGLAEGDYRVQATLIEGGRIQVRNKGKFRTKMNSVVECDINLEQMVSLTGRVYLFGIPKGGVQIRLSGRMICQYADLVRIEPPNQCYSGIDGAYKFTGLLPGRYKYSANFTYDDRQYNYNREIDVQSRDTIFDIHLCEEGTGEVVGYVYENTNLVPNVRVSLNFNSMNIISTTDSTGAFRFCNLPAGTASLNAFLVKRNSEYPIRMKKQFVLNESDSIREDFHFTTGSGVLDVEIQEDGAPVTHSIFSLVWEAPDGSEMVFMQGPGFAGFINNRGRRFDCLPAGRYELLIKSPFRVRRRIILGNNEEQRVFFDFASENGGIQGTVTSPLDEGESGTVALYLFKPGTCPWQNGKTFKDLVFDNRIITIISVNNGHFSQGNLPAGSYDVVAVLQKDELILKLDAIRVTLAEGEGKSINLNLLEE